MYASPLTIILGIFILKCELFSFSMFSEPLDPERHVTSPEIPNGSENNRIAFAAAYE